MSIYFAWVDASDTAFIASFEREDEQVLAFEVSHDEGDCATATIEIKNPRTGLLALTRKQWAWLSFDDGVSVTPLFFGRVVALPEGQDGEVLRLTFVARAPGFDADKAALADSLRVLPWYDPIFVASDLRGDADTVLDARSQMWHVDRINHALTVSDILEGEDGTLAIGADFFRDSLNVRYTQMPISRISVNAEFAWDQIASGIIDVGGVIAEAAMEAGTTRRNVISSYTGQGLQADWPGDGESIGPGWTVASGKAMRLDGVYLSKEGQIANTDLHAQIYVPLWTMSPRLEVSYDISRSYTETVAFSVSAGVQGVFTDAGYDVTEDLTVQTSAVTDQIDGSLALGAASRRSYVQTDRGRDSLRHLALRARARLRAASRSVEVSVEVPFATAIAASLRKNASLTDARLPGSNITGKITSYRFGLNGERGEMSGEVTIGLAVGVGDVLTPVDPVPAYVEDDYAESDWQAFAAGSEGLAGGDVLMPYSELSQPADDSVSFDSFGPESAVLTCLVQNGQSAQEAILAELHEDADAVISALNGAYTKVSMELMDLDGLVFLTDYVLPDVTISIPSQIDLGAA